MKTFFEITTFQGRKIKKRSMILHFGFITLQCGPQTKKVPHSGCDLWARVALLRLKLLVLMLTIIFSFNYLVLTMSKNDFFDGRRNFFDC